MNSHNESTLALSQPRFWPQIKVGGLLGYAGDLGLLRSLSDLSPDPPLLRYLHHRSGNLHPDEFLRFFHGLLLSSKSLVNSLLLGVGTVITTSILGIAIAFLLLRYDFPGRNLFSYLTIIPMIMPPLVGVMGFVFILGRAGTVNVILMDYLGIFKADQFHVRGPRGPAGGDPAPLSADDPEHRRCHGKDIALPR